MPITRKDEMQPSEPQTESAAERGERVDVDNRKFGRADHDPEGAGDIADEGPGHRDVRDNSARGNTGPGKAD